MVRKVPIGINISELKSSARLESSEDPYTFLFMLITENMFQHDNNWNQRMPILNTGVTSCVHNQTPVKNFHTQYLNSLRSNTLT